MISINNNVNLFSFSNSKPQVLVQNERLFRKAEIDKKKTNNRNGTPCQFERFE